MIKNEHDHYRQHGKHALANVECVPPVVIENHSVVFSDSQQPSAQRLQGKTGGKMSTWVSGPRVVTKQCSGQSQSSIKAKELRQGNSVSSPHSQS